MVAIFSLSSEYYAVNSSAATMPTDRNPQEEHGPWTKVKRKIE